MGNNDQVRVFVNIIAPLALLASPLTLAMVIYAFIRDRSKGLAPNLFEPVIMCTFFACTATFLLSLWYCRSQLGWFKKKN